MENKSPRRNLEPLLRDEAPTGPRLGAYAPPPAQLPVSDSFDLRLTATDSVGQVIAIEEEDDDQDLPSLPPLVSYCSYVRLGCAFGKWILLVAIVNIVAASLCFKAGYFSYSRLWPLNSWHGWLLAVVWFLTAVWFYLSAKVLEKDVQLLDRHYEPSRQSEDDLTSLVPNYEHVYGQVSRKIDAAFHSPNEPTSSLVNGSFALWAVWLGGAVFLGTGLVAGTHYDAACDRKNLSNATASYKGDFSKIQSYPAGVQDWIVDQKDPWGNRVRIDPSNDDYYGGYGGDDATGGNRQSSAYDFPTAYSVDYGVFATMNDGTVFFAGQPPKENHDVSDHLVLVESPGDGGLPKYHLDIVNPRMLIPVAKTLVKDDANENWVATQYCFTASKDAADRKKNRRSWNAIIRITPMYCISTKEGAFEISKSKIVWADKVQPGAQVNAASSGNEILVSHTGMDDRGLLYQEVVSLNPNNLEFKPVYHLTSSQDNYYGWDEDFPGSEVSRCIQGKVQVLSAIASMVVLVLCGLWLIIREGVPAGVAPILLSVVSLIRIFAGDYSRGLTMMSLTFGTLFFHGVLVCGNVCQLPAWMGRDMYAWALYSWIMSFLVIDWLFQMSDVRFYALFLLGLSGVLLNHPIPYIIGSTMVLNGLWYYITYPFFEHYWGGELRIGTVSILIGIGVIGLANFLSNNRRYCVAACRPISRAGRTVFYGTPSARATVPAMATSTV